MPASRGRRSRSSQRRIRPDRRDLRTDALLFGVYTPELFPTEIRLRANGICNTLGRGPRGLAFIVGALMASYQLRA